MENQFRADTAQNSQLQSYINRLPRDDSSFSITLTNEEMAAVLAAYDYGVEMLNEDTLEKLDCALASVKQAIWG